MRFTLSLAWRDLRSGSRTLGIFVVCLALGALLISATGGLFQQVRAALLSDTRALFGGDLEVEARAPLDPAQLAWMRERGDVSLLIELRTMLRTADGRVQLIELQSADARYPLYGEIELTPPSALAPALALRAGQWGAAIDPALAARLQLAPGDVVRIGELDIEVRALIVRQPDRSLRADWRGQPVMIAAEALHATGLVQPASRVSYRYRVRTAMDPQLWSAGFAAEFPDAPGEVRTMAQRSERLAQVLGQVGSGLLLIAFSALFIGGVGMHNSVHAYLQGKLRTLATLRALGLRNRRLAGVYVCQILLLAAVSSGIGSVLGGAVAYLGMSIANDNLPGASDSAVLVMPTLLAWLVGVLSALSFALPALGRALAVPAASLFRRIHAGEARAPRSYRLLAAGSAGAALAVALMLVPQPALLLAFLVVSALLLMVLEGLVRAVRAAAQRLAALPLLRSRFAPRLALARLYRPGSTLRISLLSLGTALTLLVASALVVATLFRTLDDTLPQQAPALVFYDIPADGLDELRAVMGQSASLQRLDVAPLVLGRLAAVNGQLLRASGDTGRVLEARDEHKLSYRAGDFDHVVVDRGAWWPQDYRGPPLVAMEDREADQLGLVVGDRLRFEIEGESVEAELAAIYSQRHLRSRFWFEAIFSDATLERFITRHVGAAYMDPAEAIAAQNRVAAALPGIVTVRTESILRAARHLLDKAASGLGAIAAVSLLAAVLVLASAIAVSRTQQVYDAAVLHTLGARVEFIRRSLRIEYAVLAGIVSVFATAFGSLLAFGLMQFPFDLGSQTVWWVGAVVALGVSSITLGAGARYLLRQLDSPPARLMRDAV